MSSETRNKYLKLVEEALKILKQSKWHQIEIARIALEVCDLSWGGRKREEDFSLKKFSKDIGVPRKTLDHWIQIKKDIYDKIDEETLEKMKYTDLVEVLRQSRKNKGTTIRHNLNVILSQSLEEKRFRKYLAHVKSVFYNSQKPFYLKELNDSLIEEMADINAKIVLALRSYLVNKKAVLKEEIKKQKKYKKEIGAIV